MLTDQQLLRDYAERRSEVAFAELVRRHVDLVYSAALRMVCDSHLAEDVTQGAFVALARSAPQLTERAVLAGWLHRTAQNIAAQTVRTDVRRHAREQEAAAMSELFAAEPDGVWEHIAPHLDAALGALNEADRDALMLRYFERKSAQEMAQVLGISDEAAQKRVSRAVERLREFFAKRGVTVGASGLVAVISANAVQAAPAGLAGTLSTAAVLDGTAIAATATVAVGKAVAMTMVQKTLMTLLLLAFLSTAIYKAYRAADPQDPPIVALRFVTAADAFTAIQQKLGGNAAEAVSLVDEKHNTVALNSTHSQAAIVRAFLTGFDQRPPEIRVDATITRIERQGTNVTALPEAAFTTNILRLLNACTVDSTTYVVNTNTWKQRLGSDCLIHLTWAAPAKIRLMGSSNQEWEDRVVDEILVPLPTGKWPDHFFVKNGSNVLSFTKWLPNALTRVVVEPALQLSSVPPYASLIKNTPTR